MMEVEFLYFNPIEIALRSQECTHGHRTLKSGGIHEGYIALLSEVVITNHMRSQVKGISLADETPS